MKRHGVVLGGLVAVSLMVSGGMYAIQKMRWETAYRMGDVATVGSRRIDARDAEGKQFFAELTPATRVYKGRELIEPTQLPAGAGIMVFGDRTAQDRIRADVVRVIEETE